MDLSHHWSLHGVRSWFSRRVPSISKWPFEAFRTIASWISGKSGKNKTRLLSLCFFLLALVLGFWANQLSEIEATLKWERTHLPSERIVRFALGSRGMRQIHEVNQLQKAMRSIPSRLDDRGSIWMSGDANWVAFFGNPDEALQAQIYCLHCSTRPDKWKSMGIGWRALEAALDEMDRIHPLLKPFTQKKGGRLWRDPREINY